MSARETILAALRQKERTLPHPPAWRSRRAFDNLADRFTAALSNVGGEVIRAESLAAAVERLGEQLEALNAQKVVVNAEAPLTGLELPDRWPQISWHIAGQSGGDLRQFCAGADVGLSSADAALAETGTIVLTTGPGRSRLATLLPTVHIALVSTARLTTDIFTWTAGREGGLPANVVLVSGPSKSADIGQTLAVGVHGPKRFMVILYEETV